ncbi:hypothetical protein ACGF07_34305 [Kitasatospora sp. NPDC048194]|uniref:hypothetical protein n=1 Tax=Kitasatospora sp. NPDC048194 TaxID=3364045 RepID=UPI0037240F5B
MTPQEPSRGRDFLARVTELAATGALGALRYGAPLPELAARYGDPWDGGGIHREGRWPHAFGFGDVLAVFCRCRRLRSLTLPAWQGELDLPREGGGAETYATRVGESELTAALTAAGCSWRTVTYENVPDQRTLEFSPAEDLWVALVLAPHEGHDGPRVEDWLLHKALLWGYEHADCPEPDPALPDDGWGAAAER